MNRLEGQILSGKKGGWLKLAAIAVVLSLCFGAIGFLGFDVQNRIEDQATATSDNVQWNLSQLEVEYLRLEQAALAAEVNGEVAANELRRRFDVFYSRMMTFWNGSIYADLRSEQPAFLQYARLVRNMLDNRIPLIDGSDEDLIAEIGELRRDLSETRDEVREMSLVGMEYFTALSSENRTEIWLTLTRLAVVTLALVLTLLGVSFAVFRLYRVATDAADERLESNARLQAMVASTLDAVIVANTDGVIVEFNGAAEDIFGYTAEDAVGASLADLIIPQRYRRAHEDGMMRYKATGRRRVVDKGRVQLEAVRKDGSEFPCEFSISSTGSGPNEMFVSFLRDISNQVEAEKELLKARDEALASERAKAEFLAVMSHEMRTPLNGMLGTLELLSDTRLDTRQRDYLRIMETSGTLLLHHVNDVLDISRLDSGKLEVDMRPFNLSNVVNEVVAGQRAAAVAGGNKIHVDMVNISAPMVLGDPQRLQQILINLLSNAIKFTQDGEIRVEIENVDRGQQYEIRVIDTGIGIAPENLNRVFEDFVTLDTSYSRNSGGTGLGLGIVKRLTTALGGEIGLESEEGEGSMFWLRLPMPTLTKDAAPTEAMQDDGEDDLAPDALNVLVVEDNQINRIVVEEMLKKEGHRVTLATDGQKGVEAAAREHFDIILMDISMPVKDGVDASRDIRGGDGPCRDVPIVALTAHALPNDIRRYKAAGMSDALIKPITRATLARTLEANVTARDPAGTAVPAPDLTEFSLPTASDPLLNTENLATLINDLGEDKITTLLGAFVKETNQIVDSIADDESLDDQALIATVHKLAGSTAMFGTERLCNTLRHMEGMGKSGQSEEMRALRAEPRKIWVETFEILRTELPQLQHG